MVRSAQTRRRVAKLKAEVQLAFSADKLMYAHRMHMNACWYMCDMYHRKYEKILMQTNAYECM